MLPSRTISLPVFPTFYPMDGQREIRFGTTTVSFPQTHSIDDLVDPRYELRQAITVVVKDSESGYIAYDDRDLAYGLGRTVSEALDDYRSMLMGEFEALRADRDSLAQPLLYELQLLETLMRPRQGGPGAAQAP